MIRRFWVDTFGALEYIASLDGDRSMLGVQSAGWATKKRTDKPDQIRRLLCTMEARLNEIAGNERMVEWWGVYLPRHAFVNSHTHDGDWSAVVYIDDSYSDGRLLFNAYDDELSISPEQNLAVVFPSACPHIVTPSRESHRFSLAINRAGT